MATNQNGRRGLSSWLVRGLSRLLVLILAFVAGAVTMHVGMHAGDREHMQALQAQNGALHDELTQSQASLAALTSQANVQGGTQKALQDKVAELQQTLGNTRDQLSFYEQLLPPGPAGTVAIRAFSVQPQDDFLHYRVLLTRNTAEQSAPFKGRLRFVATGRQNGKTVQLALTSPQVAEGGTHEQTTAADASAPGSAASPAASPDTTAPAAAVAASTPAHPADPLALDFDQYQRSVGVLQGVPGLAIQSIRVDILEGDTVRASQSVPVTNLPGAVAGHSGREGGTQ